MSALLSQPITARDPYTFDSAESHLEYIMHLSGFIAQQANAFIDRWKGYAEDIESELVTNILTELPSVEASIPTAQSIISDKLQRRVDKRLAVDARSPTTTKDSGCNIEATLTPHSPAGPKNQVHHDLTAVTRGKNDQESLEVTEERGHTHTTEAAPVDDSIDGPEGLIDHPVQPEIVDPRREIQEGASSPKRVATSKTIDHRFRRHPNGTISIRRAGRSPNAPTVGTEVEPRQILSETWAGFNTDISPAHREITKGKEKQVVGEAGEGTAAEAAASTTPPSIATKGRKRVRFCEDIEEHFTELRPTRRLRSNSGKAVVQGASA